MINITSQFEKVHRPVRAILLYEAKSSRQERYYLEAFDIDPRNGRPINARPFTEAELSDFCQAISQKEETKQGTFQMEGLLPEKVLYVNTSKTGYAIWYTPAQHRQLLFSDFLGIPSGEASIPALLWVGYTDHLCVYALASNQKPDLTTALYHAPFFNMSSAGRVCMGTVEIDLSNATTLEGLMAAWEDYFFNSYFSHLSETHNPLAINIVNFWTDLITDNRAFPTAVLQPSTVTLSSLLPNA